jgi:ferritin
MLGKRMEKALNGQVNEELRVACLYRSMSAYLHSFNLVGFANWMQGRPQDKLVQAIRICDYINERGGRAILPAVAAPPAEWGSPLAAFLEVHRRKQKLTALIDDLMKLATAGNDYITRSFLYWSVNDQAQELDSANQMLRKLQLVPKTPGVLFSIDPYGRVFAPPG